MPNDVKTSATDPIYVDWLPARGRGAVGLTIAPGKRQHGAYSGVHWKRDLGADLERLREHPDLRVDVLVSLLEDAGEYERLQIADYREQVVARGFELIELPIADRHTPTDRRAVQRLVEDLDARLRRGQRVVIHCAGGVGRSGTIAGCLLAWQGLSLDEAFAALLQRSPNCPENDVQRQYIRDFAAAPSRAARIRGAVLGAAIGDAMGHPTEFIGSLEAIRHRYGADGVTGFELWWERDGKRFAPYTDDTQMAEAVLRTLVAGRHEALDLDAVMRKMAAGFVAWNEHPQGGHRAPGRACQRGCQELARGVPWREAGGPTAGGCGSVMRAYPFGLVYADDEGRAEEWAVEHSRLTHGDPIALAACGAMAVGTVRALRGGPVDDALSAMVAAAERHSSTTAAMMRLAIDEARTGIGPEVTLDRLRGWAAHEAIAAAVYLLARHPDDPRAPILEGANTPGDSDSIATLAGALVGARCGIHALPSNWIRDVERSAELSDLADEAQECLPADAF